MTQGGKPNSAGEASLPREGAQEQPEDRDIAALARGGRTNIFGFLLRLAARLPFLFIAGRVYGAEALGRFAFSQAFGVDASSFKHFDLLRMEDGGARRPCSPRTVGKVATSTDYDVANGAVMVSWHAVPTT